MEYYLIKHSHLVAFTPAKPGIYSAPRPVTFAPNVTPVSYVAPDDNSTCTTPEPPSPTAVALFPPSASIDPPRSRRRVPPHKRRSLGYIPRPPNAFMLFRADFVRQKHVPGTIETNHGSLSKIIGNCWRALPLDEKRVWEIKAKHEKAAHKARYPEYRFRPVHNKNKNKDKKDKQPTTIDDERRCEQVAQLLLEGKKGDELAAAVRDLDLRRAESSDPPCPAPFYPSAHLSSSLAQTYHLHHRRSSSVPLPNDYYSYHHPTHHFALTTTGIALPSVPSFPSRPASPHRMILGLGQRRASSAQPYIPHHRSWAMPAPTSVVPFLQRDDSPLPDFDKSLFNQDFFENTPFGGGHHSQGHSMDFNDLMGGSSQSALGPLDGIPPHQHQQHLHHQMNLNLDDFAIDPTLQGPSTSTSLHDIDDPLSWISMTSSPSTFDDPFSHPSSSSTTTSSSATSHPSTAHSSPIPPRSPLLHAPQPQSLVSGANNNNNNAQSVFTDLWKQFTGDSFSAQTGNTGVIDLDMGMGMGMGLSLDMGAGAGVGVGVGVGAGVGGGIDMDMDMGLALDFLAGDADMTTMRVQQQQQQQQQQQGFAVPGSVLDSLFEPRMFQGEY